MKALLKDRALAANLQFYRALALIYPLDLRLRYGAEMHAVFAEQLSEAWAKSGMHGLLRAWFCVIFEILCGPAPRRLLQSLVSIPVVSLLGSSLLFAIFYRVFYYVAGLTTASR
jgi:hypothetical protein